MMRICTEHVVQFLVARTGGEPPDREWNVYVLCEGPGGTLRIQTEHVAPGVAARLLWLSMIGTSAVDLHGSLWAEVCSLLEGLAWTVRTE